MPDRGYVFWKKCVTRLKPPVQFGWKEITAALQQRNITFVHKVNWESHRDGSLSFAVSSLCWVHFHIRMNENPSAAQKVEKSIRKLADGCRRRPIIRQSAGLLWLTHVYAQLPSPLRITSRCRTSRTPAAIPRPPPPPRPPPQRLPCPAAPRPPLPCIPPPSRRGSRSSSTWQVPEDGAGISNLTVFMHFCCGMKHLFAPKEQKTLYTNASCAYFRPTNHQKARTAVFL